MDAERPVILPRLKVPQPFPYQGSKRALAPLILPYVPGDCATFFEPFAGSAAMSLAVAVHKIAQRYVINDLNEPLARLWKDIVADPDKLASQYMAIWEQQHGREIDYFKEVRSTFNESHRTDELLFLLARCCKAAVRYNRRGEFNQAADPRRKGMLPSKMRANLREVSALLKGKTEVTSMSYAVLCERAEINDVIYMDPPYRGVCGDRDNRYLSTLSHDDFVKSLRSFNKRGLSFIISYDGRTGDKTYGEPLPDDLNLEFIELEAGRSSQATLLGRDEITYESLYLSAPLLQRIEGKTASVVEPLLL